MIRQSHRLPVLAALFILGCAAAACSSGDEGTGSGLDPALRGAIAIESPTDKQEVRGHSVDFTLTIRDDLDPASLAGTLNGEDLTVHIRRDGSKASGRVGGLRQGENTLVFRASGAQAAQAARAAGGPAQAGTSDASGRGSTESRVVFVHTPRSIEQVPSTASYRVPGLAGRVEVLTDLWGVHHVYAVESNPDDLAFANGYVVARNRLFQVDFFRKVAEGRIAELMGVALDESVLATDVYYRTIMMTREGKHIADVLAAELERTAPDDFRFIVRFTEGVNAYIADLKNGRNGAQWPQQYKAIDALFAIAAPGSRYEIEPLTPAQVLAIGRLQQWDLSSTLEEEIWRFQDWCGVAAAEKKGELPAGTLEDVFRAAPPDPQVILPPGEIGAVPAEGRLPDAQAMPRPAILEACIEASAEMTQSPGSGAGGEPAGRRAHQPGRFSRPAREAKREGAFSPAIRNIARTLAGIRHAQATLHPRGVRAASNNWTISPALTRSGFAILANDPHLSPDNPSILYPIHGDNKTFAGGTLNFSGNTFPGLPGILLGQNERLAWGETVTCYDVIDVYLEDLAVGGSGARTVRFKGAPVPVLRVMETFKIRGAPARSIPIDIVPHHGPQVPDPDPNDSVEGIDATGMSFRWTGHEVTRDLQAFLGLVRSEGIDGFFESLKNFGVGGQNFVGADVAGNIGYFPHALIPIRSPGARSPDTPPYLPQPGTGEAEWESDADGRLRVIPPGEVPQARNPAQGFIVTANHDISGTVQDNDALDDAQYLYYSVAPGWRGGEATAELAATPQGGWTPEASRAVQGSHVLRLAKRFLPFLFEALGNEQAFAGIDSQTRTRMEAARGRLEAWDSRCETGVEDAFSGKSPSAEDVQSSIGASLFNVWLTDLGRRALDDESARAGIDLGSDDRIRALLHLLEDTGRMEPGFTVRTASGPGGQSALWDDVTTPSEVETRDRTIVLSFAQAMRDLEQLFGTADQNQWRWGKLHRIVFELQGMGSLLAAFNLPSGPLTAQPPGYPRAGAFETIDPADFTMSALEFRTYEGPAMRMVAEMEPGAVRAWNVLPGGTNDVYPGAGLVKPVQVRSDIHYGDQIPLWLRNEYHPQFIYWEDVTDAAESRLTLTP